MTPTDPDTNANDSQHTAASWARRLLRAEAQWMIAHLADVERTLWLSPHFDGAADPTVARLTWRPDEDGLLTGDLRAAHDAWPIADDTLDQVVLQHPLDSGLDIAVLIAEAMRVLRPEREIWLFASASLSLSRFRLASALHVASFWPEMFRAKRMQALLAEHGCSQISTIGFSGVDSAGKLKAHPHWSPFAPILLLRARKRRSAMILRPRGVKDFAGGRLSALPAFPASRVGLAA